MNDEIPHRVGNVSLRPEIFASGSLNAESPGDHPYILGTLPRV